MVGLDLSRDLSVNVKLWINNNNTPFYRQANYCAIERNITGVKHELLPIAG